MKKKGMERLIPCLVWMRRGLFLNLTWTILLILFNKRCLKACGPSQRRGDKNSEYFSISFPRSELFHGLIHQVEWICLSSPKSTFSGMINNIRTTSSIHLEFSSQNKVTDIFYPKILFFSKNKEVISCLFCESIIYSTHVCIW